jgi:hypothetical protein
MIRRMGLRAKLVELLSRGEVPDADPDELVDVETVPVSDGPMTIEMLRGAGLDAVALDAFNAGTAHHAVRVMVPRHQLDEATALLDDAR